MRIGLRRSEAFDDLELVCCNEFDLKPLKECHYFVWGGRARIISGLRVSSYDGTRIVSCNGLPDKGIMLGNGPTMDAHGPHIPSRAEGAVPHFAHSWLTL